MQDRVMALGIRRSVSSTGAFIYWPGHAAPRGGVVCLHGSEGGLAGWNDLNCALLAAEGFAALAHSYTRNARWLTHPDIDDVPLDDTEAALMALRDELAPYRCGVGLFGVSRGAEHALLLAQLLVEDGSPVLPDAVAVHSPPDAAWPAFIVADFQTGKPWAGDRQRPAWSWRGGHDRTRPGTLLGVAPPPYPVFIAQGTRDEVWGDAMARRLVERLTKAGRPPEAHFFEGEGHNFGPDARNREWELVVEFFGRHLAAAE
jgi:acetyl esterase/lipase